MKKLKTLLITSALFVGLGLSGCGNQGTASSVSTPNSTTSQSSSSSATVDYATLAQQALAQVGIALSKYASTAGATGNISLITESKVTGDDSKEYTFAIVYSVATDYAASMSISADGKSVIVKTANSLEGGVDAQCKLHAEAQFGGKAYANTDFNVLVKAVAKYSIKLLYSAKDGDAVSFKGVITGLYGAPAAGSTAYNSIFVGDGDYGVTLYSAALPEGGAIGDYVNVSGTVSIYSNLYEIKNAVLTKITAADAPDVVTPTVLALSATNAPDIAINMASRETTLTDGVITAVTGSDGGNLTFKVKVGTVAYTIFENPSYCAAADYATFKQIRTATDGTVGTVATLLQVNDTISISGFSSFYTTAQIVNAKVTKWTQGVEDTTKPTSITIADLANKGWDTSKKYTVQGFVTGYYTGVGTPKNGLFIADGASGLDVYGYTGDCTAFTAGTCVTVVGSPSVFSGLIEFTASSIAVTATADITAQAAVTAEVAGITGFSNSDQARPIHATGVLTAAVTGTYGSNNLTAKVTIGNGETLPVYLHKSNISKAQYEAWTALAANSVVEFTGFLANYKSNTSAWAAGLTTGMQVVSPTIVKVTAPTGTAVTPIAATQTIAAASAITTAATAVDAIGFFQGCYVTNPYSGVYVGDGESSIMAYKTKYLPLGTVAGTPLRVTGAVTIFNGLQEIDVSAGSVIALPKTAIATTIAAPVALAISATVVPSATNLNRAMTLTDGVVKTITTAVAAGKTNGTYVVTVGGTVDVTVYVNKSGLAAADYTAFAAVAVGGKLSLNGFSGCYKTAYQIVNPSNVVFTPAA